LSEEIADRLKEAILAGELKPGQELPPEREMAKSFGVSRVSLREALNTLQAAGLVEIQQGNRTCVRPITTLSMHDPLVSLVKRSMDDFLKVFEVRRFLEMGSAYLAAQRATKSDIKKLEENQEAMKGDLKKERLMAKSDFEFHQALAEASHNLVFSHILHTIFDLLQEELRVAYGHILEKSENRNNLLEQHNLILEAVKQGDPDKALEATMDHLVYAQNLWSEGLGRKNGGL
jgi:GntR family transcriptional repressor for pyruvate dehydrogenase complex